MAHTKDFDAEQSGRCLGCRAFHGLFSRVHERGKEDVGDENPEAIWSSLLVPSIPGGMWRSSTEGAVGGAFPAGEHVAKTSKSYFGFLTPGSRVNTNASANIVPLSNRSIFRIVSSFPGMITAGPPRWLVVEGADRYLYTHGGLVWNDREEAHERRNCCAFACFLPSSSHLCDARGHMN